MNKKLHSTFKNQKHARIIQIWIIPVLLISCDQMKLDNRKEQDLQSLTNEPNMIAETNTPEAEIRYIVDDEIGSVEVKQQGHLLYSLDFQSFEESLDDSMVDFGEQNHGHAIRFEEVRPMGEGWLAVISNVGYPQSEYWPVEATLVNPKGNELLSYPMNQNGTTNRIYSWTMGENLNLVLLTYSDSDNSVTIAYYKIIVTGDVETKSEYKYQLKHSTGPEPYNFPFESLEKDTAPYVVIADNTRINYFSDDKDFQSVDVDYGQTEISELSFINVEYLAPTSDGIEVSYRIGDYANSTSYQRFVLLVKVD